MKFQKISYFLFSLTLCVFSLNKKAIAKDYACSFKVSGQEEKFTFSVIKNQRGTGGSFNDFTYFMGIKNKKISIKIQDTKTASQVQSEYSISRDLIELSKTPGWDLVCKVDRSIPEVIVTPKPVVLKLDEETPLEKFKADISFTATTSMKVKYSLLTAKQRMRSIIFQKGRLFTTDDDVKRDLNGNWCILQVQLELDQDTMIREGHNWQTVQYKTLNNSSSHTVYAYSFIDPAQGKVSQRFKRYVPFNIACQIKKDVVFNQKMWRQITGDRIKLYYNP